MLIKHYRTQPLLLAFQILFLFSLNFSQSTETVPAPSPKPDIALSATAAPVTASNEVQPSTKPVIAPEDLIHFGDLVEIDVIGSVEYDWRGRINPEGFIPGLSFAAGPLFALCQNEEDIAQKVAAAYGKFLRNPQITVKIADRTARPITTLLGAVKTPQLFKIRRAVRLNELIALSGGIIDNASGEIRIFRPARLSCGEENLASAKTAEDGSRYIDVKIADLIAGKPDANPFVKTGDIVTVQEAASIYVIGGVNVPQTIYARQEMTVSRAIATAGGTVKGADTKKIVIYRRQNGATTSIDVDLAKIGAKQADDVVLQALDIIEVPLAGRDPRRQPPVISSEYGKPANGAALPVVIVD